MEVEADSVHLEHATGLDSKKVGTLALLGKGEYTWRFTVGVRESHGAHIYCGDLTSVDDELYLATVGKNRASVYTVNPDGDVSLIQAWDDEDTEEVYYTCAFTADSTTGDTWLAAAGKRGIIKVINVSASTVSWLIGHGNEVNHFVWHPTRECVLLSASKDESIRLWNVRNRTLIAIFAGRGGHRYDVLSIAFHPTGTCFLSGGMDNSIKLWNIDTKDMDEAITQSYTYDAAAERRPFNTRMIHRPHYSTINVHNDYVDFVCFIGDLILSKCAGSCTHKLMLWSPNGREDPDAALPLIEYTLRDCEQWFVKVGIHPSQNIIAVGTQHGKIQLLPFADTLQVVSTAAAAQPPAWLNVADLHKQFDFGADITHPSVVAAEENAPPAKRRSAILTGDDESHVVRSGALRVAPGGSSEPSARSHRHADLRSSEDGGPNLESFSRDPSTLQISSRVTIGLKACKALVRQVLFTPDGNTMIALCDDSTIWRWDLVLKSDCKPDDAASYTSSDSTDEEAQ